MNREKFYENTIKSIGLDFKKLLLRVNIINYEDRNSNYYINIEKDIINKFKEIDNTNKVINSELTIGRINTIYINIYNIMKLLKDKNIYYYNIIFDLFKNNFIKYYVNNEEECKYFCKNIFDDLNKN